MKKAKWNALLLLIAVHCATQTAHCEEQEASVSELSSSRVSRSVDGCFTLGNFVDCSKKNLVDLPSNIPDWVEELDLSGNRIHSLQPGSFDGFRKLRKLTLASNKLSNVSQYLFTQETNIVELSFGKNSLQEIPLLKNVPKLTTLVVNHNHIRDLPLNFLCTYNHLTSLDLSSNQIEYINATFLSRNCDTDFQRNSSLKSLSLVGNRIETLEENAFANVLSLESLKLSKNKIVSIPLTLLRPLNALKELDLSRNKFTKIEGLTFQGLVLLKSLKLQRNELQLLEDGAFWELSSLEKLHLNHNNLTNVTVGWLYGMRNLIELHLTKNQVQHIDGDGWHHCPILQELRLDDNEIKKINRTMFHKLNSLKSLALDRNKISFIDDGSFRGMHHLETLTMNGNYLSFVIEDANAPFSGLDKLRQLGLAENNIKSIARKAFAGLGKLKVLDLLSNPIVSAEEMAFANLKNIQELKINSTSFLCDCKLRWLVLWVKVMTSTHRDVVEAICGYPIEQKGAPLLELNPDELKCDDFPKPYIMEEPQTQIVLKGSNIILMCKAASSSSTEMSFSWRKDNEILNLDTSKNYVTTYAQRANETNGMSINEYANLLHLVNVEESDAGNYQCSSSNAFGSVYSQRSKITVHEMPTFLKSPENVTNRVGQTARLDCAASGQPAPQISWRKDGGDDFPAARERRMHFMPSDEVFFIVEVKADDAGMYTCYAKNDAGEILSNATLTVLESPYFEEPMFDRHAPVGGTIALKCLGTGSPKPLIKWTKDGVGISSERYYYTANDQLLIITQVKSDDSGRYACNVSNSLGSVEQSSLLEVISEDKSSFFDRMTEGWASMFTISAIIIAIVLLTSVIWVCIIYKARQPETYYMTDTGETVLPEFEKEHDLELTIVDN
ncbi:Leucine-rich repeats and immunoglobulin-like domains protein 3 [Halotydeus destructor]|nr:Leucine-rich repeats and immunoglobulin-like domains protein 3 [Halotydeus destructor]